MAKRLTTLGQYVDKTTNGRMAARLSHLLSLRRSAGAAKQIALLLALIGAVVIPRLFLLVTQKLPSGLGYDELQSVTHAYLPVPQLLSSVESFDPHPPLYYLQLHLWTAVGTNDLWLWLNSLLWNLAAISSLYLVSRRLFERRTAMLASFLFALAPYPVIDSLSVRMYSPLTFLAIGTWFFTHRFLYARRSPLAAVGIGLSTLGFLYSHGAGFLIGISTLCYAALFVLEHPERWRRLLQWLLLQLAIVAMYLPWLLRARTIHVEHPVAPELRDVAATLAQLLLGARVTLLGWEWILWLGLLLVGVATALSLRDRRSRNGMASFAVAPIVACLVISHLIRPIWLPRTLAFITPFLSLSFAVAILGLLDGRVFSGLAGHFAGWLLAALVGLGTVAGLGHELRTYRVWSPMKEAARYVAARAGPADIVYVPHERVFWGWCWYFIGPGSVNPLTTDYSTASAEDVQVVAGQALQGQVRRGRTYWIVVRDIDASDPYSVFPAPGTGRAGRSFANVTVELFAFNDFEP